MVKAKHGPERKAWIRFISCLLVGSVLFANTGIPDAFAYQYGKRANVAARGFLDEDSDGDGLGDTWEMNYFGDLDQDQTTDFDGDGFSDLWEYRNDTDPTDPYDPNYHLGGRNNALEFLKYMMDSYLRPAPVISGTRIIPSYIEETTPSMEGFGWTYDNALAVMAFLKTGKAELIDRAGDILDAYDWFQDNDPSVNPGAGWVPDGRIRRAYFSTEDIPSSDLTNKADMHGRWIPDNDAEARNQAVGDMAFMILAALRYYEYINGAEAKYLTFAENLGNWIAINAKSEIDPLIIGDLGGYHMARTGHEIDPDTIKKDRKSTENNIDVYVAFMKLYEITGNHEYRQHALHAKNFILAMWNSDDGMFWTGTLDDGMTINNGNEITGRVHFPGDATSGQPEDPSSWGLLALGEKDKYGIGIDWIESHCKVEDVGVFDFGYDFNADQDGIWFEGMSHIALAYQLKGGDQRSKDILDQVLKAQDDNTGGIQSSASKDGDGVSVSFTEEWQLGTNQHVAPVAWYIFAVDGYNPFWGQPVTDPVPYEGGYNAAGDGYIFDEPWTQASATEPELAADGTKRALVEFFGDGGDDKGTLDPSDDGFIVKYEWDFDGKGTYDWSSTADGNVQYWYTEEGAHLAKFRVTNNEGITSTRGVSINITNALLGGLKPPEIQGGVGVDSGILSGPAPFQLDFTSLATDDNFVAFYEWDFNGDGEYEHYSTSTGNVTHVYTEPGEYLATVRATDNDGLTDTASTVINVLEGQGGPTAKANAIVISDDPLYKLNFIATGSLGSISTYQWDFEGDSVYETYESGMATHTYGEPGTYEASLRVIDDTSGISDTDTVTVVVPYTGPGPTAYAGVIVSDDTAPFDATFDHSLSAPSTGASVIDKYEWDFHGNKITDRLSTDDFEEIVYTYTRPGFYLATLKVVDNLGFSARAYLPIASKIDSSVVDQPQSAIKSPLDGQKIYGDSVTVKIELIPDLKDQEVRLKYKRTDKGKNKDWDDNNKKVTKKYATTIDATSLYDPNATVPVEYDLKAYVNGLAGNSRKVGVIIDPDWDIHETVDHNGERIKRVKIKSGVSSTIWLVNGVKCEIPQGAVDGTEKLVVRSHNGSLKLISDVGEQNILYHTEFTFESGLNKLKKAVTIHIPYEDANDDGFVDGMSNVPIDNLRLYYYDVVANKWVAIAGSKPNKEEGYVTGQTDHFTIFGLGGGGGGIAGIFGGDDDDGRGTGRSCFIATATYGTAVAGQVQSLRFFRDTYMLTNAPGNFAIDMYEKYSPPIAKKIENSGFLKGVVRYHLRPIITFARWINIISREKGDIWLKSKKAVISHD
jgi:PKD repeat protein